MKYKLLIFIFFLGILVGYAVFSNGNATGASVVDCYVENAKCVCDDVECVCGDQTVPSEHCTKSLNTYLDKLTE